jgi:hypothetical protein
MEREAFSGEVRTARESSTVSAVEVERGKA